MDDVKRTYREGEESAKEAWRKADGEEDAADTLGNLGDAIKKGLGNAGDQLDDDMERRDRDVNDDRI